jgi:hypothetical protein
MRKLACIVLFFNFSLATGVAQRYQVYFSNKVKADSLRSTGNYRAAIPSLRVCVSEPEWVTVEDEFFFGYALFKDDKIDSAAIFMRKALKSGFHFHDMGQLNYWEERGVLKKIQSHKAMEGVAELLQSNTANYVNHSAMDSTLRARLVTAREQDQRFRGANANYKKQRGLDKKNQRFLRQVIKEHGWPGWDIVGYDGMNAAFLIAQHSDNDKRFQRQCLHYIHDAFYAQKVDAPSYAYIIDRTRINAGQPQLFGTQFETTQENGEFDLKPKSVEDEPNLGLRRKVFGLVPIEKYLAESKERLLRYQNHLK